MFWNKVHATSCMAQTWLQLTKSWRNKKSLESKKAHAIPSAIRSKSREMFNTSTKTSLLQDGTNHMQNSWSWKRHFSAFGVETPITSPEAKSATSCKEKPWLTKDSTPLSTLKWKKLECTSKKDAVLPLASPTSIITQKIFRESN